MRLHLSYCFAGLFALVLAACDKDECDRSGSQPLAAPCCESLGVDACGAGLFCAALDGRAKASCYAERSRADRASCTADVQCACRSAPRTACDSTIGCAPDPANGRYGCGGSVCDPVGNGTVSSICAEDGDCYSGFCKGGRCRRGPCYGGDGSGPCAESPGGTACRSCVTAAENACATSKCADLDDKVSGCAAGCGTQKCFEGRCESAWCDAERCAGRVCPDLAACY